MPIVDHGVQTVPKTIQVSLFGPSPIGMASPSKAVLTILNNDPRHPARPPEPAGPPGRSGRRQPAVGRELLRRPRERGGARRAPEPGARRDRPRARHRALRQVQLRLATASPTSRPRSRATSPRAGRVAGHGAAARDLPDPARVVRSRLRFAGGRRLLPQLHRGLRAGHRLLPRRAVPRDGLDHHDAVPVPSRQGGPRARASGTRSTSSPPTVPHLVIYLDAGAADALSARDAAKYLRASGVAKIQGFFLNATHFDWTSNEIRYGNQISRLTGRQALRRQHRRERPGSAPAARHRARRQRGPVQPARTRPRTAADRDTGYPNVDMFAWTSNPGESGGSCVAGAPPTGVVLARLRGDAGAERRLQRPVAATPLRRSA